jgi:Zn-dependent alcohol dehydrogenase
VVHKKHKAVDNNNNHNSHNLHLQGATETNNMAKAQILLMVVGSQMAATTVHRNTPARVTAKMMVAEAVVVATVVATAVGIVANPAGVRPTPTAARHPTKASTGAPGRNATKRGNS